MKFLKGLERYQIIQLIIVVIFIIMLIGAISHPNTKKEKTYDPNYVFLPALMDSDARYFLDNMVLDLGIKSQVVSAVKEINFGESKKGSKYANNLQKMNGYVVTPTSLKANNYFKSKSFKIDTNNSVNMTFNSTSGYTNGTIICTNSFNTVSVSGDYSKCNTPPFKKCTADGKCIEVSQCTVKSETFCADLNQ